MGRHDWADRAQGPEPVRQPAPAPGRLRVLVGRSSVVVLVVGALAWISVSILFNPPPGGPQQIQSLPLSTGAGQTPGGGKAVEGRNPEGKVGAQEPGAPTSPPDGAADPGAGIVVHVIGAVRKPGVYELRPGSRALDAVKRAGGLRTDAAPESVNLAAEIADGTQLRIPVRGERSDAATRTPVGGNSAGGSGGGASAGGLLDINKATGGELEELPGIGPALAGRIIEFRESNGPFKNLAELDAVSGIGPAMLASLRTKVEFR